MIVQGSVTVKSLTTLGTPKCMKTSMSFPYMIVQSSVNVICLVTLGTPKYKITSMTLPYMIVQGSVNVICLVTLGTQFGQCNNNKISMLFIILVNKIAMFYSNVPF